MRSLLFDVATGKIILSTAGTCLALFIAYLGYKRKSGLRLRGTFVTTATIACDDNFVSRVTVENLKDRAVTIFAVYLRLGYNTYVLVEEFGAQPLVLKPYETLQRDYDPIEFYSMSSKRIRINELLKTDSIRKRLVLSTSDGKYTVRKYLRPWDPVHTFFRNYTTAIIRPIRSEHKGKAYGGNAIFLVELTLEDKCEQIIPIYPQDYRIRRFRNVRLTQDSLQSKQALEAFLEVERQAGRLQVSSIKIHDLRAMRDELFDPYNREPVPAKALGPIRYYVVGWLATRLSIRRLIKQNKKQARANAATADNKV